MEVLARKITYEEFAKMDFPDDDPFLYELINGELVRKNAPSGEHQFVQSELFYRLMHFVTEKKLGRIFSSPTAVILSEENAPQPNLIFLSKDKMKLLDPEWGIRGAPDMVVEIVSPSSYKRDHLEKKRLYAQHGVVEYWIVDPRDRTMRVLRLSASENSSTYHEAGCYALGQAARSVLLPGFSLDTAEVFDTNREF